MILREDPENVFYHQLTKEMIHVSHLKFALHTFKDNVHRHCVIRKRHDGRMFAVFTEGKAYVEIYDYAGNVERIREKNLKRFPEVVSDGIQDL